MPASKKRTREEGDGSDAAPKFGSQSRRAAGKAEEERKKKQKLLDVAQETWQERETELAKRGPIPAGNRGDGSLHLAFIKVGQGECVAVATPGGRVLIFDCGPPNPEDEKYGEVQD